MFKQYRNNWQWVPVTVGIVLLSACNSLSMDNTAMEAMVVEDRHLTAAPAIDTSAIPDIVKPLPLVNAPQTEAPLELYSVVLVRPDSFGSTCVLLASSLAILPMPACWLFQPTLGVVCSESCLVQWVVV